MREGWVNDGFTLDGWRLLEGINLNVPLLPRAHVCTPHCEFMEDIHGLDNCGRRAARFRELEAYVGACEKRGGATREECEELWKWLERQVLSGLGALPADRVVAISKQLEAWFEDAPVDRYSEFMKTYDTADMGRIAFEGMGSYDPEPWHFSCVGGMR